MISPTLTQCCRPSLPNHSYWFNDSIPEGKRALAATSVGSLPHFNAIHKNHVFLYIE